MLTDNELRDFKKSIESKSTEELKSLFNKLNNEKAVVVEDEIFIRGLRTNFLGRENI
jgi:hypothetical protein